MKVLVTGGAGFIGTSVVRHLLGDGAASSISTSSPMPAPTRRSGALAEDGRYALEVADVADRGRGRAHLRAASARCGDASRRRNPCRPLDRRPGTISSTPTSSAPSRCSRRRARLLARRSIGAAQARFRFHHVSTDEVFGSLGAEARVTERRRPTGPNSPYAASQGRRRSSRARLAPDLRPAGGRHQLLQQLRAVAVSGKADPADDPQRARGQDAAGLRRRRQCSRLALCRRSCARRWRWCCARGRVGETYNIGGGEERTNIEIVRAHLRASSTRSCRHSPHRPHRTAHRLRHRPAGPRSALCDRRRQDPAASFGWRPVESLATRPARDRALVSRQPRLVGADPQRRLSRRAAGWRSRRQARP